MGQEPKVDLDNPIFVIGGPGLAKGPIQMRCSNPQCDTAYPIQVVTQLAIFKAKKEGKTPIVMCYLCLALLRQRGVLLNTEASGVRQAMKRMGL